MHNKNIYNILVTFISFLVITACGSGGENSKHQEQIDITDMANRKVSVPVNISSVFCADMTCTQFMYALAPEKLIARNMKPSENEKPFTTEEFQKSILIWECPCCKSQFILGTDGCNINKGPATWPLKRYRAFLVNDFLNITN